MKCRLNQIAEETGTSMRGKKRSLGGGLRGVWLFFPMVYHRTRRRDRVDKGKVSVARIRIRNTWVTESNRHVLLLLLVL